MEDVGLYLYMMAVGFVAAGILASFVQLVSGQPLRFGVETTSRLTSIGAVLLCVFAGPAILMANAWRAAVREARSPVWLGFSLMIAGAWSLVSGAVLLDLIL